MKAKQKCLTLPTAVTVPYHTCSLGWHFVSPPPDEHVASFSCPECRERFKFNVKWNALSPDVKMVPKKGLSRTLNFEPSYVYVPHGYLEIGGNCPRCKKEVHFDYDDYNEVYASTGEALHDVFHSSKHIEIIVLKDGYRVVIHEFDRFGTVTGDGVSVHDAVLAAFDTLDNIPNILERDDSKYDSEPLHKHIKQSVRRAE